MKAKKLTYVFFIIALIHQTFCYEKPKKIVGLIQVRNEEIIILQCLQALSLYTDAMVILDDASTDNTLTLIETFSDMFGIEKILKNNKSAWETGNESENKQKLLNAGRTIGGTHFICIDADEMFTANCMDNNFLRTKIYSLEPGQAYRMHWIQLWKSINFFNAMNINTNKDIIFCDRADVNYDKSFLHGSNLPKNLSYLSTLDMKYGLLHFQFVNWRNVLIKHAWYRCLEHIRYPKKSTDGLNKLYGASISEQNVTLTSCPKEWFQNYAWFDATIYNEPIKWRENQVLYWFKRYGKDYFKDLSIWDIDWKN